MREAASRTATQGQPDAGRLGRWRRSWRCSRRRQWLIGRTGGRRDRLATRQGHTHQQPEGAPPLQFDTIGVGFGANAAVADLEIEARHILRMRDQLYKIYADATAQPMDKIAADCERNNWLTAQEMLSYGLIDKVLEKLPVSDAPKAKRED